MATYRVKTDPETVTQFDPNTGGTISYTSTPGPLTITDQNGKSYNFNPGDFYPDWAYAIYSDSRIIEMVTP